jgi:regulator of cell morphogenesis and NO signaling
MQTSLRIDGANCPTCFNETVEALTRLDGVRAVRGSVAGPCIEIDHDGVTLDVITGIIRSHLHGIDVFSNETGMVPLEAVEITAACAHHRPPESAVDTWGASEVDDFTADGIDLSMTLGEIVTLHPSLAVELERRGLDYCCHGARTLATAARDAGLDPRTVADELSVATVDEPPADWASLGLLELVDHIESVHHRHLWVELPRISALVDKIVEVHGDRHAELAEVHRLSTELRADLEPHLAREEQTLFPMIRRLVASSERTPAQNHELVGQIEALAAEHETVGALLEELNRVTGGYTPPADGCASYAACYLALAELEADTHLHVHKESNVLFPALVAESADRQAARSTP